MLLRFSAAGPDGFVEKAEITDRDGVVLSAIGANCGRCFFASGNWTTLANVQAILPKNGLDARYLFYFVNRDGYWDRSGSAQPFIKPSSVYGKLGCIPESRGRAIQDRRGALYSGSSHRTDPGVHLQAAAHQDRPDAGPAHSRHRRARQSPLRTDPRVQRLPTRADPDGVGKCILGGVCSFGGVRDFNIARRIGLSRVAHEQSARW